MARSTVSRVIEGTDAHADRHDDERRQNDIASQAAQRQSQVIAADIAVPASYTRTGAASGFSTRRVCAARSMT